MATRTLSTSALALFSFLQNGALAVPRNPIISFRFPDVVERGGMHNVHVEYHAPHDGELSIVYGSCDITSAHDAHHVLGTTHVGNHNLAKRHMDWEDRRPTRFVWLTPEDTVSEGCLHAYSGDTLLGRSTPISLGRRNDRRWLAASEIMDAMGPWFDGVEYLKEKEPEEVFVAQTKSKTVGILGGGMSGLMTAHLLDSVGFYDWQIIEASSRIGGRVHTAYLNGTTPDQYQYQEMGPMRFPVSLTLDNETLEIQGESKSCNLRIGLKVSFQITKWSFNWPVFSTSRTMQTTRSISYLGSNRALTIRQVQRSAGRMEPSPV